MSSEVLLALFRPHQGIRVRARGGGDEYRLKKSMLRIPRSWGMPRRDLQSVTVQLASAKSLQSPRRTWAHAACNKHSLTPLGNDGVKQRR